MKPDRRLFVVVVVSFSFRCCRRCCRCCCCWLLLLLAVARLASFHGNWSRCRRLNPTRLNPTDEPKKKREPDELEKPAGTRPWPAPSATTRGENVRKSNNKINNNNNNNNNNFTARRPACGYDTFGTKKNPVPRKKKVTPQKKARERERERETFYLERRTSRRTDRTFRGTPDTGTPEIGFFFTAFSFSLASSGRAARWGGGGGGGGGRGRREEFRCRKNF